MKINIVEKGPLTFYGIPHPSDTKSDFVSYWNEYYKNVSKEYRAPIGFSTFPDVDDKFTYYTCIQHEPENNDLFEVVQLPKGNYAIFELKGSVTKTIPIAWKFATENFIISKRPSIEVYSVGNRLDKNYRMNLWIPIDEILPSFEINKGFIGSIKRSFNSGYEKVVEFSKTDTGRIVFGIGSAVFVAGITVLLSSIAETETAHEFDYTDSDFEINEDTEYIDSNDEEFDIDNYVVESVQSYGTHDYPEERDSPRVHGMRRRETGEYYAVRGGTEAEKEALRKELGLD